MGRRAKRSSADSTVQGGHSGGPDAEKESRKALDYPGDFAPLSPSKRALPQEIPIRIHRVYMGLIVKATNHPKLPCDFEDSWGSVGKYIIPGDHYLSPRVYIEAFGVPFGGTKKEESSTVSHVFFAGVKK